MFADLTCDWWEKLGSQSGPQPLCDGSQSDGGRGTGTEVMPHPPPEAPGSS